VPLPLDPGPSPRQSCVPLPKSREDSHPSLTSMLLEISYASNHVHGHYSRSSLPRTTKHPSTPAYTHIFCSSPLDNLIRSTPSEGKLDGTKKAQHLHQAFVSWMEPWRILRVGDLTYGARDRGVDPGLLCYATRWFIWKQVEKD
jgi:hypothetical protein